MPYWMWIGNNSTQYNATPSTNLTTDEANSIVGYTATGSDEMGAVMVNGQILGGNFQTTFNPTYGIAGAPSTQFPDGGPYGGTQMSYTSDATGAVTGARITTAIQADFRITDLDANGNPYTVGVYRGLFVQMSNGDVFFRPVPATVNQWTDEVSRIYSIRVMSTTIIDSTNSISSTIGFHPSITDVEIIPCFTAGTMIRSAGGDVLIEDLRAGAMVQTLDHGLQPVRWIGRCKLSAEVLQRAPQLRPIRISAGALGDGVPTTDLIVSPQHRVLVRSKIAQRMFGALEVLVAAKQLLQLDGIDIAHELEAVDYFHMLFDQHEIILTNGAETESLYTGPQAIKALGAMAREEVFEIFPELRDADHEPTSARLLLSGRAARKLAVRHQQNSLELVN